MKDFALSVNQPDYTIFAHFCDFNQISNKHIFMQEQEEQVTLNERLLKRKATAFDQNRQLKLQRKIFSYLTGLSQQKKQYAINYYNMILCVKSFKGIMESAIEHRQIQIREAEQRQRQKQAQEIQIQNMTIALQTVLKQRYFRRFCKNIRIILQQRIQKQRKEKITIAEMNKFRQSNQRHYQTGLPTKSKEFTPTFISNKLDKTTPNILQNSRKSIVQQGLSTQQAFKRKFTPIKTLPPKPKPVSIPQEEPKIIKQIKKQSEIKPQIIMNNIPKPPNSQILQQLTLQTPQQRQKDEKQPHAIKLKDKILGLLSQIKMIQIMSLNEIIQQSSKTFINESNIAQKSNLKQSLKLLQRISMIK